MRLENMRKNELVDELFNKHGFSRNQAEALSTKLARKVITLCRRNLVQRVADDSVYQAIVSSARNRQKTIQGVQAMCQQQATQQNASDQKVCYACGQPAKFTIEMINDNGRLHFPNQYARREKIIEVPFCRDCIHEIEESTNNIVASVKQNNAQPADPTQASA